MSGPNPYPPHTHAPTTTPMSFPAPGQTLPCSALPCSATLRTHLPFSLLWPRALNPVLHCHATHPHPYVRMAHLGGPPHGVTYGPATWWAVSSTQTRTRSSTRACRACRPGRAGGGGKRGGNRPLSPVSLIFTILSLRGAVLVV